MSNEFDNVKDVNILSGSLVIVASTILFIKGKKQFWQFASIAVADLLYVIYEYEIYKI